MCDVDEHKKKKHRAVHVCTLEQGNRNVVIGKIFLLQATAEVMYAEYM